VGPIQLEDDESFFKKEGKNIVSHNPCGSSDCKVCEGAEIYHDDGEVYNWDFWNSRHITHHQYGTVICLHGE
jgi:hypothetical protein